jgi:hypothetical protein
MSISLLFSPITVEDKFVRDNVRTIAAVASVSKKREMSETCNPAKYLSGRTCKWRDVAPLALRRVV